MTGNDLIVFAPWVIFGAGLGIVYLLLRRSRRSAPPSQAEPTGESGSGGRPESGAPVGCSDRRARP